MYDAFRNLRRTYYRPFYQMTLVMKNFEKFLQYSKKLEELQTARKAKEVDEIQKFDIQTEHHKHRELDQMLEANRHHVERVVQDLDTPVAMEQERIARTMENLREIEAFESQFQDTKLNTPGNEFEIISELQGNIEGEQQSDSQKQLPAASSDAFTHELTELTEVELQRELEANRTAISRGKDADETESNTATVESFRQEQQRKSKDDVQQEFEQELTILEEGQTPEKKEAHNQDEKDADNVFFFRPAYTPKRK